MAFPVSPADGQITEINGVTYQFVSADSAWIRIPSFGNLAVGNINTNNITANANITAGNVYTTNGLFWSGNGVAFSSSGADEILRANVGAYQLYANANISTLFLGNAGTQANLGAFQTYSNTTFTALDANIGTLFLGNASTQANIAAFYAYANTKIGNNSSGNLVIAATTESTSNVTGALVVAGGVGVAGNVFANTIYTTTGIRWSGNGVAFSSGGGSGTPGGSDTEIQYNSTGSFAGSSGFTFNSTTGNVTIASNLVAGNASILGNTSTNRLYITTGLFWSGNGASISTGGGSGTPGGSDTQMQFNDGGSFNGANITFNKSTGNLVISSVTTSTSTTTGALVVRGGIGVAGNVTADKLYTTAGLFWSGNGVAFSSGGGGSGTPGGSDTQIQYNSGGTTFAGSSGFTFNSTDGNVTVTSNVVAGNARITNNVFANKLFTTVGLFWAGNGVAFSSGTSGGGGGGGITYTSDTAPPLSPNIADQWYDTTTDVLYEYLEDGTSSYWVDVLSPMFSSGITNSVVGNVNITGPTSSIGHLTVARTTTVSGNIITLSNINVSKSANVLGNLTVGGNVAFSRDAAIAANLTVVGNVASGNVTTANISATGNITATGSITATGTISATTLSSANITVTSNVTTANVSATDISSTGNITSGNIATNNLTASNIASGELTSSGNITAGNVTVSGNVTLTGANVYVGNIANLSIAGGTSGQYLQTNGSGDLTWQTPPATNIEEFTATASQTTFTVTGTYTVGSVLVFVNGIQMNSADYTATNGTTVVLTEARNSGDTVRVVASFGAASLVSGLTLNVNNLQTFAVAMSIALGI